MHGATNRRPIPRSEFDALTDDLARAEDRLRRALEDGAEDMRGWSDIAEKAAFAESMASLQRRVVVLKSSLEAVFPEDDAELFEAYRRAKQQQEIDEIVARALANADVYRLEVWEDGQFVRQVLFEAGPCDPEAVAKQLKDEGVVGALRVIRGERGSPEERCVSEHPL